MSELAAKIGLSQPTVSHHLLVLKNAGIVRCRKMCRDVYYWIDGRKLVAVRTAVGKLIET